MKNKILSYTIYETVSFIPCNFTERALQYLYVSKLDPKNVSWKFLPGGILDFEEKEKENGIRNN